MKIRASPYRHDIIEIYFDILQKSFVFLSVSVLAISCASLRSIEGKDLRPTAVPLLSDYCPSVRLLSENCALTGFQFEQFAILLGMQRALLTRYILQKSFVLQSVSVAAKFVDDYFDHQGNQGNRVMQQGNESRQQICFQPDNIDSISYATTL